MELARRIRKRKSSLNTAYAGWLRPNHAKVRSTTQWRGMTSKPTAVSERLTIWIAQLPIFASTSRNFGPA